MGSTFLLLLVVMKELGKRSKRFAFLRPLGPISVCVIALCAVYIGNVDEKGIKIIGSIQKGLPSPTVGWWGPMPDFVKLFPIAIVVMLVDLLESTSIARALAMKNKYELVPNQEIVGLGLANFAGAAFQCYTTTGSFSRSSVNNEAGKRVLVPYWGEAGSAFKREAAPKCRGWGPGSKRRSGETEGKIRCSRV